MAEDEKWTARERRDQLADEAITVMLHGLKSFFEGHATLHVGQMQPGVGHSIRFVTDDALTTAKGGSDV